MNICRASLSSCRRPRRRVRATYIKLTLLIICVTIGYYLLNTSISIINDIRSAAPRPDLPLTWRNSPNVKSPGKVNKLILFWTPSWSERQTPVRGWDVTESHLENCDYKCDVTTDRNLVDISDALIYHGATFLWFSWEPFARNYLGYSLLPPRSPKNWNQRYIFFLIEPPGQDTDDLRKFDNFFNWTATYRLDSDITYKYGRFYPLATSGGSGSIPNLHSPLRNGSQLVAWMSSRCHTGHSREGFAAKLSQHLPIAFYGGCSDSEGRRLNCGSRKNCYDQLSQKHKFWLSFENSLCQDYLTEKYYMSLLVGMVPIVYAHPSITKIALPGSFINVADFKTVEELANHVKWLGENEAEYLKYFEWRKRWNVEQGGGCGVWCNLCTKLNEDSTRKSYESLNKWWYTNSAGENACIDHL